MYVIANWLYAVYYDGLPATESHFHEITFILKIFAQSPTSILFIHNKW